MSQGAPIWEDQPELAATRFPPPSPAANDRGVHLSDGSQDRTILEEQSTTAAAAEGTTIPSPPPAASDEAGGVPFVGEQSGTVTTEGTQLAAVRSPSDSSQAAMLEEQSGTATTNDAPIVNDVTGLRTVLPKKRSREENIALFARKATKNSTVVFPLNFKIKREDFQRENILYVQGEPFVLKVSPNNSLQLSRGDRITHINGVLTQGKTQADVDDLLDQFSDDWVLLTVETTDYRRCSNQRIAKCVDGEISFGTVNMRPYLFQQVLFTAAYDDKETKTMDNEQLAQHMALYTSHSLKDPILQNLKTNT
jgi:hypothetical protein